MNYETRRLRGLVKINPPVPDAIRKDASRLLSFVPMEAIGEDWSLDLSRERPVSDVLTGYSYFENDDILLAKVTPCIENGKSTVANGLRNGAGFGTTEVTVIRPSRSLNTRFVFYVLNEKQFKQIGESQMTGAGGLKRVPDRAILDYRVELPNRHDQDAIASFLDRETAEIDAFIADQEELIALLAERRAATIDHVVKNGIPPKDSASRDGSHAIEAVAPGWRTAPLKELATLQTGVTLGKEYDDGVEFPYLRVANVQVGYVDVSDVKTIKVPARVAAASALQAGDVLMTEGGDRDKLGRGAIWDARIDPCLHQNHVFAVRCDASVLDARMLSYVLDTAAARSYFYQTAKQATNLATTNSTIVRNFRFAIPSTAEQRNIVDYLDEETAKLDAAIADAREAIVLSKERRAALISAAVTGKIDVRGAA